MGLRAKFNIVLIVIFSLGLAIAGFVSYHMLRRNARAEVHQHAGMMMEAALAIRSYTVKHVKPLLEMQLQRAFLPESVPAFAATETLNALRQRYPEYTYKEATLNPTNPRNRATDWEADLVQAFRNRAEHMEIVGERHTPAGSALYIARPIHIKDPACLVCHNRPEEAPATMLKQYGPNNGFGWKLNEIIGAQVVSIPMTVPMSKAEQAFLTFMVSLVGIFLVLFITLNLMLHFIVIHPLARISQMADAVSTGNFQTPVLTPTGKDEVSVLARSFNRMRRSLEKAMEMMEQ